MDTVIGKEKLLIVKANINAVDYSPLGTFIITCEKFQHGEKNLILWSSKTGKEVTSFAFKKTSKEGPKSIKFTKDESYCARLATPSIIEIF